MIPITHVPYSMVLFHQARDVEEKLSPKILYVSQNLILKQ